MNQTKPHGIRCATCRWYDTGYSQCRRRAPQGRVKPPWTHEDGTTHETTTPEWPYVFKDDFCGEWEANAEDIANND